jgi:hypothetical protein
LNYDLVLSGPLDGFGLLNGTASIAPHINGSITFVPDGKGGYSARGERDGFPWAEAYQHDGKGGIKTIFKRPAVRGTPEDLNAIENDYGLSKPFHTIRARYVADPRPQADTICNPGGPC